MTLAKIGRHFINEEEISHIQRVEDNKLVVYEFTFKSKTYLQVTEKEFEQYRIKYLFYLDRE